MGSRADRSRGIRRTRPGLERLESRAVPTIDFAMALGVGVAGTAVDLRANAVAVDAAGNVVVVGSIMGTADFDPGPATFNLTSRGNRDAFVARYSPAGALLWAETFPGLAASSVAQGTAVAVDSAGNIEVAGSFSGAVNYDPGPGSTVLNAPSRTDAFVVKLDGSGRLLWAVASSGTTNDVDAANAVVPDGSGGVYLGGSYADSATFGATTLTASGLSEAFVARVDATGHFAWARSTSGGGASSAEVRGIAVDPSGRVVLAGDYAGTVRFDAAGTTALTSAGGRDVAVWVVDASGSLAWARGFGGPDFDQADAVAVDASGDIYATGAFTGTVDFNPGGTPDLLSAGGGTDVFVLKVAPGGTTTWAGSFAGSGASSRGEGIGVDATGRVAVAGWFGGRVNFDPAGGPASLASAGAEDAFVALLDPKGGYLGATRGGGAGSDMASGLAVSRSGAIATAGMYTGPASFGAITLPAIGRRSVFVATLVPSGTTPPAPAAPKLEAASDTGDSPSDGVTSATSPVFDVAATAAYLTVQLLRDGQVVASRAGTGPVADPGPVPDGPHAYTARQVDPTGPIGPASPATTVTILTVPPAAPPAPALLAADDSGVVGDGITRINPPRLTGTAAPSARVQVLDAAGNVVASGRSSSTGSYTVTPPSPLAEGVTALRARAIDVAGNVGAAGPAFALTIDTVPPAPPSAPALLAADDSGVVGDGITNVRQPRLTGTAEPGATVELVGPAGETVGTATASGSGAFTVTPSAPLADGTYPVRARATDAAGNVGPAGPSFALTILATPPPTPAAPALLAADDSGTVGDGITYVASPRLVGTVGAGLVVRLLDGAGNLLGTATASSTGAYTVVPSSRLPEGANALSIVAVDAAGNVSPAGPPLALTIDTIPPVTPSVLALLPADDSGVVGDGITNVRQPRFTGAAEAGTTVRLVDGSGRVLALTTATPLGTFVIRPAAPLPDGPITVHATATDPAANTGPDGPPLSLTILSVPPAAPSLGLLAADDTGIKGDGVTAVRRPRVTGLAKPGSFVELLDAGGLVVASTSASAVDGSYRFATPAATAGLFLYRARATDAAGNVGPAGPTLSVRILAVAGDFDGDGKADVATYNAATAVWTIRSSIDGSVTTRAFGHPGIDVAVPADYDGDGKADIAVYSPPTAEWFILNSSTNTVTRLAFGHPGEDLPIPGDYDGDGKADVAVFQPSTATWFVRNSGTGRVTITPFGGVGTDVPVPADYDGDGRIDLAVYRPATAEWFIRQSSDNATVHYTFGHAGEDRPIPADYDGDGKADIAVFQPSTATWFVLNSSTMTTRVVPYGTPGVDQPSPYDDDGDGRVDISIFRPTTAEFYVTSSRDGTKRINRLGTPYGDRPALMPMTYRLNGLRLI